MRRVNEALREVLADEILNASELAGIDLVTVTAVDTSPDLRNAKVYISTLEVDDLPDEVLEELERIRPHLQRSVAKQLHLKNTPRLKFSSDPTVADAARIYELIDMEIDERRSQN